MVYSLKLTFVANGNNPTDVGLAPGKKIYFESLEFIIDRFDHLILSPTRATLPRVKWRAPDSLLPEGAMW
jgi:hypothetical protein